MPGATFLSGETVDLRTAESEDVAFMHETVNDPAIRVGLGIPDPQTRDDIESRLERDDGVELLVCVDGEPVGSVSLSHVDEPNGHGMLGCWLAPEHQGEGYAADATRTMLDYCFGERRLRTVKAHVYTFNEPSYRLLESVGMERVGRIPDWAFVDGEYHDEFVYATTADDWR